MIMINRTKHVAIEQAASSLVLVAVDPVLKAAGQYFSCFPPESAVPAP